MSDKGRLIATVYLPGTGLNRAVRTGGDRTISFRGGAAYITDERDMPAALAMAGAKVEIESKWADFLGEWASKCTINQPAVAEVHVAGAEGDTLKVGPAPTYSVVRPTPPVERASTEKPSAGPPWSPPRRKATAAAAPTG